MPAKVSSSMPPPPILGQHKSEGGIHKLGEGHRPSKQKDVSKSVMSPYPAPAYGFFKPEEQERDFHEYNRMSEEKGKGGKDN